MRIATGALRPRNDGSRKNLRVIPRPVRRLVVGIRNTPAQRTRRTDCHTSDIGHWFAMTHYKKCGISPGGTMWASSPTECLPIEFRRGRRPRRPASVTRSVVRRADVGIGPYGSATRGAVGGRPQGSPLRRGYKGCGETGRCGHRPLRMGCRGGRPCPPSPDNATPCRAGPVCPAVGAGKIRARCPGQKTKSPPAFAKDDALHRGTTLLRGLLTQAAL